MTAVNRIGAMLVGMLGVCAGVPACTQVSEYVSQIQSSAASRKQEIKDEEQAEALAANFRRIIVEKMVSARILVNAHPYEGLFVMPAAEFARLRDILSRTEAVRPAHGENVVVYVSHPSFLTLELKDAQGLVYELPMMDHYWMRKSEADALLPDRARRSDEPCWCLPDADFAELQKLPTVRQARAWGRLYSPGTSLVMPNAPSAEPAAM